MNLKLLKCTMDDLRAFKKLSFRHLGDLRFKINTGILEGCILPPSYISSDSLKFVNPLSNRDIYVTIDDVFLVEGYSDTYISDKTHSIFKRNTTSCEEAKDKYGGTVYLDSIVAYYHHKKSADESLRFGLVKHISKSGTITVVDALTGSELKLSNSKRHAVIDDSIQDRIMMMKLSK